jgi:signal peptidase II
MFVLWIGAAVALLDQATKHGIRSVFPLGGGVSVIEPFFDLRYVRNTGAAWGVFEGYNHWLVLISVAVLLLLARHHRSILGESRLSRLALAFMLGGIAGNLVDRVRLGFVVDFLDFHWNGHHFPAFNVADSAICVGVALYLLTTVRTAKAAPAGPEPAAPV